MNKTHLLGFQVQNLVCTGEMYWRDALGGMHWEEYTGGMHWEKGREELKRLCAVRGVFYEGTHIEEIKGTGKISQII